MSIALQKSTINKHGINYTDCSGINRELKEELKDVYNTKVNHKAIYMHCNYNVPGFFFVIVIYVSDKEQMILIQESK